MNTNFEAVIFDLDGVIVSTDDYHYRAWKELADKRGVPFDREVNERLRGVSRMESLQILLEKSDRAYSDDEKLAMAEEKNTRYREMLAELTPENILPGVTAVLDDLSARGIRIAIGPSSKNAPYILKRIGLENRFEAVADGNHIKNSKPDPEVFLLAAEMLGIPAENCVVVEDAIAGIDAALAAGMKAVAVGYASSYDKADYCVNDLSETTADKLL